jgi:hypothetical protein
MTKEEIQAVNVAPEQEAAELLGMLHDRIQAFRKARDRGDEGAGIDLSALRDELADLNADFADYAIDCSSDNGVEHE